MKNYIQGMIAMSLALLLGCKKTGWEDLPSSDAPAKLEGVWKSEGHGYILEIKNGTAVLYDYTDISCLKKTTFFDGADKDVATWSVILKHGGSQFIYRSKTLFTEFRFNKLEKLPSLCEGGGTADTDDPLKNFDVLWQTFNEHYAFFGERNIDWQALRAQYRPKVNASNLKELFETMLTSFGEDHVTLVTSGDDFLQRFDAGAFRTFERFSTEQPGLIDQPSLKMYVASEYGKMVENILTNYLNGTFNVGAGGQMFWGTLGDATGYILINQFAGYEMVELEDALNQALNELRDTKGMIIDLRGNLGGYDRFAMAAASRFIDKDQPGWMFSAKMGYGLTPPQVVYIRPSPSSYTNPVRVLTSIGTSSAAEVFTMVLKQNNNIKQVGETTNGIFSNMLDKRLPNGWRFTLSNERYVDAQSRLHEGKGLFPDIPAPFPSAADRATGKDPALDEYLAWF